MGRFMSFSRTEQPIEKFLMEFGLPRQKAEKLMFPAGGGFEDVFMCFQRIKAASLKPNDRTLLMASLGETVDFARMTQQLRQLFHAPQFGGQGGHFPGGGGEVRVTRRGSVVRSLGGFSQ